MFAPTPRNALVSQRIPSPINPNVGLGQAHIALGQAALDHGALVGDANQDPAAADTSKARLMTAIGTAAAHSDTPSKWAATLAILHRNGIDPAGYEDFARGRMALAVQAHVPLQLAPPMSNDAAS